MACRNRCVTGQPRQRIPLKDGNYVVAGLPLAELSPTTAQAECLRPPILQRMLLKKELSTHACQAVDAKKTINQAVAADKADTQVSDTDQQLALHTEGGVAVATQALMGIVPDAAGVSTEVTLAEQGHRVCGARGGRGYQVREPPLYPVRHGENLRGQGHAGRGE